MVEVSCLFLKAFSPSFGCGLPESRTQVLFFRLSSSNDREYNGLEKL